MRFCKVAILMAGTAIIISGCAGRQHNQGYRSQAYNHGSHHQAPVQHSAPSYGQEYHSDPPAGDSGPVLLPNGPSQPVPAPPPTDVSLRKVQGVSFTKSCTAEPTCALPADVCAEAEGCQTKPSCVPSFWKSTKSYSFLKGLCYKPKPDLCAADSCSSFGEQPSSCHAAGSACAPQSLEGCETKRSCLPKFSVSGWFTKCFNKPTARSCDPCVSDDGCSSVTGLHAQTTPATGTHPYYRRSPLAAPLEDPFTQPAPIRRSTPQQNSAPTPVPDVPANQNTLKPVDPMPSNDNGIGNAQPAQDVPAPPAANTLDPMPSGNQTYVEPSIWPRLRAPSNRVANVPASQTSWNQSTQSYSPPVWSNPSPWTTSWQMR